MGRWLGLGLLALAAGCGNEPAKPAVSGSTAKSAPAPTAKEPAKTASNHDDHGHGAGPHGGTIIELGGGKFHGEFTVDHSKKQATIHILAEDAKTALPVKAGDGLLAIKSPAFTADLKPAPFEGEKGGLCSRFVANDDRFGKVQEFEGTATFEIDGKPFSGDFKEEAEHGHDGKKAALPPHEGLPAIAGTEFEKELYLKPGGKYTAADIAANGPKLPSVRFAGLSWEHADDAKPGDRMCPVTNNKAEAGCDWIVDGKSYQFCCPPCVDKFVKWAKTQPERIKEPGDYVKRM